MVTQSGNDAVGPDSLTDMQSASSSAQDTEPEDSGDPIDSESPCDSDSVMGWVTFRELQSGASRT